MKLVRALPGMRRRRRFYRRARVAIEELLVRWHAAQEQLTGIASAALLGSLPSRQNLARDSRLVASAGA
jgi:hypothetical protein